MTRMLLGEHPMDLATIFEWFAQESMTAAEQTKVPIEREMWLRLIAVDGCCTTEP